MSEITIITGNKETGKTTLIRELIHALRENERSIGGIFSPGKFIDGKKIAIEIVNLKNGDKKILARYAPGWDPEMPMREWQFIDDSVEWGNAVIKNEATPCDVLIIDEIGYLELEKEKGWISTFDIIKKEQYKQAYIVIRDSLLDLALSRWQNARIIYLNKINDRNAFIQEEISRIYPKNS